MDAKRVVLITGGSSGIGLGIAHKFSQYGHQVIITGTNADKLDSATQELSGSTEGYILDMRDASRMGSFVDNLVGKHGAIDVLVNNAGINQKKPFTEVSDSDFRDIIEVNQTGAFILSREVVRVMLDRKIKGNIIHISSMTAHYGLPGVISYTASKTALEGMTRSMAVDLSPHGIRVNCIAPGFIETNMTAKALNSDPERKKRVIDRTPMRKLGQPEDVANAAYFLASDEASFITGIVLPVDGGNLIGF